MSIGFKVKNASVSFAGQAVLTELSLTVPAGESTVIVGPAAAGKSVFMKYVLGLIEPDNSKIRFLTQSMEYVTIKPQDIGVMFQENALFDSMTVLENISFQVRNTLRYSEEKANTLSLELLHEMDLSPEVANKYPAELSGGMQKRVALARALSGDPKLLMLDEPTAGLDPILTRAICDLIKSKITETKITLVAITSDISMALGYYDNLALLKSGQIQWMGKVTSIDANKKTILNSFLKGDDSPLTIG